MKTKNDHFTAEIFGNRPGRPRKVNALTVAQRVAKHRAKTKTESFSVSCNENFCGSCGLADGRHSGVCMVGQLG